MTSHRQERVSELLQQELSILISGELTDPRLADAMVTVTDVIVTADLRSARVYVEHVLPHDKSRQVLAALKHAEGFLRKAVLENLNLRFVPELSFHIDTTSERGRRVDDLLNSLPATSATGTPDEADIAR